jgi:hypothetical protein
MPRRKAKEDCDASAGKIVNLAEFNLAQDASAGHIIDKIVEVLTGYSPVVYPIPLTAIFEKAGLSFPTFYVTQECTAEDTHDIRAQNVYFEASSLIAAIQQIGGRRAISRGFRKSVEKCNDHKGKLTSGQLEGSAGEKNTCIHLHKMVKNL